MLIEQAIFTSTRTEQAAGYQLVARSANVTEADARELSIRGPSHDSLWDSGASASVNFYGLPSGAHCVARTVAAGGEYSGRGGGRVYTQCLVVPADVLARFANNPFAVLRAALAQGSLPVHQHVPGTLEPFRLPGRATPVDEALLIELAAAPGAERLASLIDALLDHESLGVAAGRLNERLFAGLVSCLPVECRKDVTFSTTLSYSPQRPFRLVGLPEEGGEVRRAQTKFRLPLWQNASPLEPGWSARHPWAAYVVSRLGHGRSAHLARALRRSRPGLTLADLDDLGRRLQAEGSHEPKSREQREVTSGMLSAALLAKMTARLREEPLGRDAWNAWQRAHRACLDRHDEQMAGEMVLRACQIFGVRATPEPELVVRVEQLLREQLARDPAFYRHTLRCLQTLKVVFGREFWLQLARRLEANHGGSSSTSTEQSATTESTSTETIGWDGARHDEMSNATVDAADVSAKSESAMPEARSIDVDIRSVAARPSDSAQSPARHALLTCAHSNDAIELLEQLDDVVFDAIAGRAGAYEQLTVLWPEVLGKLGPEPVEESKEQYLRYAINTWHESFDGEAASDAERSSRLVEIICLMLGP